MNPDATPLVQFRGADISNGEVVVVENLDLTIRPGEFVYLTGRVGSGKTSVIRTITGENPLLFRMQGGLQKKEAWYGVMQDPNMLSME